tara:strand:+ start:3830 stop:4252 length:423 start_codon:yes stop_codon:yes gene_type:complete
MTRNYPRFPDPQGTRNLKNTYLNWTGNQLSKLKSNLHILEENKTDKPDSVIPDIFQIVHNMKGLGSNFGYYLMTDIATSLCEYMRYKETVAEVDITIIRDHIEAMDQVNRDKISGSGGPEGDKVLLRLHKMVKDAAIAHA